MKNDTTVKLIGTLSNALFLAVADLSNKDEEKAMEIINTFLTRGYEAYRNDTVYMSIDIKNLFSENIKV